MDVCLIEHDAIRHGRCRTGARGPGRWQLVSDARCIFVQALREPVAVGVQVVRRPPARVPGKIRATIAALGQSRNLLLLDHLQHLRIGSGEEDHAFVGVPEPDSHRTGAPNWLDPLVARGLEVDHGHPGDAAFGQVFIHKIGLLQTRVRPGQDRIFDLHHRGAGPARGRGWGCRQAGGATSRESNQRDARGEPRQLAPHGRQHASLSIRKSDSVMGQPDLAIRLRCRSFEGRGRARAGCACGARANPG